MSILASNLAERLPIPDVLARVCIDRLVDQTRRKFDVIDEKAADAAFADSMAKRPIAEYTSVANTQHYELPSDFFDHILGPRRKYSCCFYDHGVRSLADAEECALAMTAEHATLADGQKILELGCGWGSLSLWMAERYPGSQITAVSNSISQRRYIEATAKTRGLRNLRVTTADMRDFKPSDRFDRVVSVEMFEHIANWNALLGRIRSWLEYDGYLFLHIFSHRKAAYRFDHENRADWIAQHFFTGGIMPSHGLLRHVGDTFSIEAEWRWNGQHYRRTALDWLANFDKSNDQIERILSQVYGRDAPLWRRRWRLFFLATAGLFGHRGGREWGVSHYLCRPQN